MERSASRRLMFPASGGAEGKYGVYEKRDCRAMPCGAVLQSSYYIIQIFRKELRMSEIRNYQRGDIFLATLEPRIGSEQGGTRPVIVLQNNIGNYYSPTLIIAPLTSNIRKKRFLPTHYLLEGLPFMSGPSLVLLEQITTIDKQRIMHYLGSVSESHMSMIDKAVKVSLALEQQG